MQARKSHSADDGRRAVVGKRMDVMHVLATANWIIDRGACQCYSNDHCFQSNVESNAINISYMSQTNVCT